MIDFLRGPVVYTESDYVVIEREGMGYQVYVPHPQTFTEKEHVFLYTHLVVREDAHRLYGFLTHEERSFFRLLLEVSGIGPKVALAMIANGGPQQMISAIVQEDLKFLTRLPGIGKKTAGRIILELKEKLPQYGWTEQAFHLSSPSHNETTPEQDVIEALIGLGYSEEESKAAARQVKAQTIEEAIKEALQRLMRE